MEVANGVTLSITNLDYGNRTADIVANFAPSCVYESGTWTTISFTYNSVPLTATLVSPPTTAGTATSTLTWRTPALDLVSSTIVVTGINNIGSTLETYGTAWSVVPALPSQAYTYPTFTDIGTSGTLSTPANTVDIVITFSQPVYLYSVPYATLTYNFGTLSGQTATLVSPPTTPGTASLQLTFRTGNLRPGGVTATLTVTGASNTTSVVGTGTGGLWGSLSNALVQSFTLYDNVPTLAFTALDYVARTVDITGTFAQPVYEASVPYTTLTYDYDTLLGQTATLVGPPTTPAGAATTLVWRSSTLPIANGTVVVTAANNKGSTFDTLGNAWITDPVFPSVAFNTPRDTGITGALAAPFVDLTVTFTSAVYLLGPGSATLTFNYGTGTGLSASLLSPPTTPGTATTTLTFRTPSLSPYGSTGTLTVTGAASTSSIAAAANSAAKWLVLDSSFSQSFAIYSIACTMTASFNYTTRALDVVGVFSPYNVYEAALPYTTLSVLFNATPYTASLLSPPTTPGGASATLTWRATLPAGDGTASVTGIANQASTHDVNGAVWSDTPIFPSFNIVQVADTGATGTLNPYGGANPNTVDIVVSFNAPVYLNTLVTAATLAYSYGAITGTAALVAPPTTPGTASSTLTFRTSNLSAGGASGTLTWTGVNDSTSVIAGADATNAWLAKSSAYVQVFSLTSFNAALTPSFNYSTRVLSITGTFDVAVYEAALPYTTLSVLFNAMPYTASLVSPPTSAGAASVTLVWSTPALASGVGTASVTAVVDAVSTSDVNGTRWLTTPIFPSLYIDTVRDISLSGTFNGAAGATENTMDLVVSFNTPVYLDTLVTAATLSYSYGSITGTASLVAPPTTPGTATSTLTFRTSNLSPGGDGGVLTVTGASDTSSVVAAWAPSYTWASLDSSYASGTITLTLFTCTLAFANFDYDTQTLTVVGTFSNAVYESDPTYTTLDGTFDASSFSASLVSPPTTSGTASVTLTWSATGLAAVDGTAVLTAVQNRLSTRNIYGTVWLSPVVLPSQSILYLRDLAVAGQPTPSYPLNVVEITVSFNQLTQFLLTPLSALVFNYGTGVGLLAPLQHTVPSFSASFRTPNLSPYGASGTLTVTGISLGTSVFAAANPTNWWRALSHTFSQFYTMDMVTAALTWGPYNYLTNTVEVTGSFTYSQSSSAAPVYESSLPASSLSLAFNAGSYAAAMNAPPTTVGSASSTLTWQSPVLPLANGPLTLTAVVDQTRTVDAQGNVWFSYAGPGPLAVAHVTDTAVVGTLSTPANTVDIVVTFNKLVYLDPGAAFPAQLVVSFGSASLVALLVCPPLMAMTATNTLTFRTPNLSAGLVTSGTLTITSALYTSSILAADNADNTWLLNTTWPTFSQALTLFELNPTITITAMDYNTRLVEFTADFGTRLVYVLGAFPTLTIDYAGSLYTANPTHVPDELTPESTLVFHVNLPIANGTVTVTAVTNQQHVQDTLGTIWYRAPTYPSAAFNNPRDTGISGALATPQNTVDLVVTFNSPVYLDPLATPTTLSFTYGVLSGAASLVAPPTTPGTATATLTFRTSNLSAGGLSGTLAVTGASNTGSIVASANSNAHWLALLSSYSASFTLFELTATVDFSNINFVAGTADITADFGVHAIAAAPTTTLTLSWLASSYTATLTTAVFPSTTLTFSSPVLPMGTGTLAVTAINNQSSATDTNGNTWGGSPSLPSTLFSSNGPINTGYAASMAADVVTVVLQFSVNMFIDGTKPNATLQLQTLDNLFFTTLTLVSVVGMQATFTGALGAGINGGDTLHSPLIANADRLIDGAATAWSGATVPILFPVPSPENVSYAASAASDTLTVSLQFAQPIAVNGAVLPSVLNLLDQTAAVPLALPLLSAVGSTAVFQLALPAGVHGGDTIAGVSVLNAAHIVDGSANSWTGELVPISFSLATPYNVSYSQAAAGNVLTVTLSFDAPIQTNPAQPLNAVLQLSYPAVLQLPLISISGSDAVFQVAIPGTMDGGTALSGLSVLNSDRIMDLNSNTWGGQLTPIFFNLNTPHNSSYDSVSFASGTLTLALVFTGDIQVNAGEPNNAVLHMQMVGAPFTAFDLTLFAITNHHAFFSGAYPLGLSNGDALTATGVSYPGRISDPQLNTWNGTIVPISFNAVLLSAIAYSMSSLRTSDYYGDITVDVQFSATPVLQGMPTLHVQVGAAVADASLFAIGVVLPDIVRFRGFNVNVPGGGGQVTVIGYDQDALHNVTDSFGAVWTPSFPTPAATNLGLVNFGPAPDAMFATVHKRRALQQICVSLFFDSAVSVLLPTVSLHGEFACRQLEFAFEQQAGPSELLFCASVPAALLDAWGTLLLTSVTNPQQVVDAVSGNPWAPTAVPVANPAAAVGMDPYVVGADGALAHIRGAGPHVIGHGVSCTLKAADLPAMTQAAWRALTVPERTRLLQGGLRLPERGEFIDKVSIAGVGCVDADTWRLADGRHVLSLPGARLVSGTLAGLLTAGSPYATQRWTASALIPLPAAAPTYLLLARTDNLQVRSFVGLLSTDGARRLAADPAGARAVRASEHFVSVHR